MSTLKVNNNATVTVYGVAFRGVKELYKYANSMKPKDGVFVGEDWQCYPCFDPEDYASENRRYSNFVFAKDRNELSKKLAKLKQIHGSCNHKKLSDSTPQELLPMIYFGGDTHHSLEVAMCTDILV